MLSSPLPFLRRTAASSSSIRATARRSYNFASSPYVSCFGNVPIPDVPFLRKSTLDYLQTFDPKLWHTSPVTTLLKGKKLASGSASDTVDAFNVPNGKIVLATPSEVGQIIEHINKYKPPKHDYRAEVRAVEQTLLTQYPGFLIGNQAVDFRKQDGVTEIEESIQANVVEQRMNDLLLADETSGKVLVKRHAAFVGCVSNFSNFLDLFRKTLRNVELGVPCVVLSRNNTTQHMYRWTELLAQLFDKNGIDAGMVTYASVSVADIQKIFKETSPDCPMYITCSRELAASVKATKTATFASTGGPNTLVASSLTPKIAEAIRFSAMIENSGQCTALRHCVVPNATAEGVAGIFQGAPVVTTPADSLKRGEFAGLFADSPVEKNVPPAYSKVPNLNAYYKISSSLPEDGMEEYWRKVFVDVTAIAAPMQPKSKEATQLAAWLVRNQPITLAVNDNYKLGLDLFERTGQVVYTVGGGDKPALTCQARPQEAEIFGEFPVRQDLSKYTKFPVIVPSPTPAYNSFYTNAYLHEIGTGAVRALPASLARSSSSLVLAVSNAMIRGYCVELCNYLQDAVGPKRGYGARTALWGLQRPPMDGRKTVLRAGQSATVDDIAARVLAFAATNAASQFEISVHESNKTLPEVLKKCGLEAMCKVESDSSWEARKAKKGDFYNIIDGSASSTAYGVTEFPLMGQFISMYLGVGHIKSTKTGDEEFVNMFKASDKWLKMAK